MATDQLLKKAHLKHMQGKHDAAAKLYHEILKIRPNHLDANYLLGTLYAETGNFDLARTYLEKADQINPSSPYIKVNLGNICMSQGDYEGARGFYRQALAIKDDLPQAFYGLATIMDQVDNDVNGAVEQYSNVLQHFQKALRQTPNDAAMLQAVGKSMLLFGNRLALDCFHKAMLINPHLHGINRDYGIACVKFGRNAEAGRYLRQSLNADPHDPEARHYLHIAEGTVPDDTLMQEYARNEFERFADTFDIILLEKLGYSMHEQLLGFMAEVLTPDFHFASAVDMGCGTGLFGITIKPHVDYLAGIDISPRMIDLAAKRGCYDSLVEGDIVATLQASDMTYDLFAATDVLVYIGALEKLFHALAEKAKPGALFAFSTEYLEGEGFSLQGTGRFAHSPAYIRSLADEYGFTIVAQKQVNLRKEHGGWIMGTMFIIDLTSHSKSTP